MRPLLYLPAVTFLALCVVRPARAEPAWGGNCLSCHSQLQANTLFVFGEDTSADPNESGTGSPDRGTLQVFQALRGTVKTLLVEVTDLQSDDTYAVQLKRLRFPGVETGGQLTYTADCDWPGWGESACYYSDPVIAYRWGTGPTTFAFDIEVGPDADYDYYDLVFAVAGKLDDDGTLFYAQQHFYLQVIPLGDIDGDGDVDVSDLGALLAAYGTCVGDPDYNPAADFDDSGCVDLSDLAALLANYGVGT